MLGKNSGKDNVAFSDKLSIISSGAVLEGDLKTEGNLRIDGKIIGHIKVDGNTAIGKKGAVEGDIQGTVLKVSGFIKGNVLVTGRLTLDATASIEGDVKAKILIVEDGAKVNGKIEMESTQRIEKNGQEKPSALLDSK
jgi:cytoskeletal protein CcmA (bactofilin family)